MQMWKFETAPDSYLYILFGQKFTHCSYYMNVVAASGFFKLYYHLIYQLVVFLRYHTIYVSSDHKTFLQGFFFVYVCHAAWVGI